ncbi:hypothetical protein [Psychrobacillus sp. NPDC096389]|uniref:hypothetical protein n=1 Tax=Psychrobacillus sp. NPDC096389 TaxID=3364490 RepID=UPI00380003B5
MNLNAKTLLEWEQKHDAKRQTIKGFWDCFKKWQAEDKYDFLDFDSIPLEYKMLEIRQNLNTVRKALKECIERKVISNITGIDEASIEIIKKQYC